MNVERRVVAVHLDQHDLVFIVFRDQDIELEASFFVSLGASGVPADDLQKCVPLSRFDLKLDDKGDFAHGLLSFEYRLKED